MTLPEESVYSTGSSSSPPPFDLLFTSLRTAFTPLPTITDSDLSSVGSSPSSEESSGGVGGLLGALHAVIGAAAPVGDVLGAVGAALGVVPESLGVHKLEWIRK